MPLQAIRGGNLGSSGGDVYRALNVPRVRVLATATQSIAASTVTPINFDVALAATGYVEDSMYNSASRTRITIGTAGVYQIEGMVCWAASATGTNRQAWVAPNGTTGALSRLGANLVCPVGTTDIIIIPVSDTAAFNRGDYVELMVFQNTVGALSTSTNTGVNPAASLALTLISTLG